MGRHGTGFGHTGPARPLRVGVLVDLRWHPGAGGHVKCWERLAAAATRRPDVLDLTVHFSGTETAVHALAANVRYVLHRPVLSTARLPFLAGMPDHTDLAPFHPGLARHLAGYDVLHTTDAYFAFARTAARVAARRRVPLVNSIHTDTPSYTRVFSARALGRLLGDGWGARLVLDRVGLPERLERSMLGRLARHQAACAYALVARAEERDRALGSLPAERVGLLRRGIDRSLFHPGRRDRDWLAAAYGIGADRVVVLFVGRLDRGKNVLTLARAVVAGLERGLPLHLLCAGEGEDRRAILDLLGPHATCPGQAAPDRLARLYAAADVYAMCSEIEVFGNVALEAMSSGLPVLIAAGSGMGRVIDADCGLVVPSGGPDPWTEAIARLASDADRRTAMGRAARLRAERALPSWDDVLDEDLLPVWRAAAAGAGRR